MRAIDVEVRLKKYACSFYFHCAFSTNIPTNHTIRSRMSFFITKYIVLLLLHAAKLKLNDMPSSFWRIDIIFFFNFINIRLIYFFILVFEGAPDSCILLGILLLLLSLLMKQIDVAHR